MHPAMIFWFHNREKVSFVISNDDTLKQPVGADKQDRQGRDIVVVEEPDEMDEDSRSLEEPPGWLPDGWIMEVCRDDDSSIYRVCTLASISLGLIGVKIYYFLVVLCSTTLPQCPDTHSHQRWRQ